MILLVNFECLLYFAVRVTIMELKTIITFITLRKRAASAHSEKKSPAFRSRYEKFKSQGQQSLSFRTIDRVLSRAPVLPFY